MGGGGARPDPVGFRPFRLGLGGGVGVGAGARARPDPFGFSPFRFWNGGVGVGAGGQGQAGHFWFPPVSPRLGWEPGWWVGGKGGGHSPFHKVSFFNGFLNCSYPNSQTKK